MKVLILTDHDRDYGADYLYDGFCRLFGPESVIDWPPKDSLHGLWLRGAVPQPTRVFDCDLDWPRHEWTASAVEDALRGAAFDLVVVPTLRGVIPHLLANWRECGLLERVRERTVYVDGEDHRIDTAYLFTTAAGFAPAAYFKRELPLGARGAKPLPFGYPEDRIVELIEPRAPRVVYIAHIWPWARGGMREQLGEALQREFGDHATVHMSYGDDDRLGIEEYHRLTRECSIAVVPCGAGFYTNRHLEVVADGCAPLYESGHIDRWVEGCGTFLPMFASAPNMIQQIACKLRDSGATTAAAQDAQTWLRAHHTTRHRARTIVEEIYGRTN